MTKSSEKSSDYWLGYNTALRLICQSFDIQRDEENHPGVAGTWAQLSQVLKKKDPSDLTSEETLDLIDIIDNPPPLNDLMKEAMDPARQQRDTQSDLPNTCTACNAGPDMIGPVHTCNKESYNHHYWDDKVALRLVKEGWYTEDSNPCVCYRAGMMLYVSRSIYNEMQKILKWGL